MIKINTPEKFNGDQFGKELQENEIDFIGFISVENDKITIDTDSTNENKIIKVLENHKPITFIDHKASAFAKLAALGLTEDEIAAL